MYRTWNGSIETTNSYFLLCPHNHNNFATFTLGTEETTATLSSQLVMKFQIPVHYPAINHLQSPSHLPTYLEEISLELIRNILQENHALAVAQGEHWPHTLCSEISTLCCTFQRISPQLLLALIIYSDWNQ